MVDDPKGYYATLGVQPSATDKLIRAAYRVRAQELHPDLNTAPDAKEQFQRLAEAYGVLSDPQRRRAYDESSRSARAGETTEFDVPFGTYRMKLAAGSTWYGEKIRFGPNTSYFAVNGVSEFKQEGDMLLGHELILSPVKNGNLTKTTFSASQF